MQSLLLSIIIPVYKVEKYIVRCLDSIYNQNVDESIFEVIAINDGSPDNSLHILENYRYNHRNLFIHTKENEGLSCARNKGLELAKGRYVWFVDSDDWLANNSLEIVLKTIRGDFDVISSVLIYSYDKESKNHLERKIQMDFDVTPSVYILNYSLGASQRYIIKRRYLEENNLNFYPKILHEDAEFGPRLIASCDKIHMLAEPIYHYYQRESGSIMSSWNLKNSTDLVFISQRIEEYAQTVSEKRIKSALVYTSFSTLMYAFQPQMVSAYESIRVLQKKHKVHIRRKALNVIFSRDLPMKKRMLALASFISPALYYNLRR